MSTTDNQSRDEEIESIIFDCIVAVGVREGGTVEDLDTLIIDRRKAVNLIDAFVAERERLARIDELKQLLHENVCEIMCGWSTICDVQGEDCPKIRKRLSELRSSQPVKEDK